MAAEVGKHCGFTMVLPSSQPTPSLSQALQPPALSSVGAATAKPPTTTSAIPEHKATTPPPPPPPPPLCPSFPHQPMAASSPNPPSSTAFAPVTLHPPPPPPPPPPPFPLSQQGLPPSALPGHPIPTQIVPLPRTKLRRFQWQKISQTKISSGRNVWSLGEKPSNGIGPNFERLEELFSVAVSSSFATGRLKKSDDQMTNAKDSKQGEVNIFDSRRSLNLNIFLRQFRSSHEELLQGLAIGESEKWGVDKLRSLIKFLPDEEEMSRLKLFTDDRSRLGCAEKFCIELASISNYRARIEAMLLKEEFIHSSDWLKPSIDAVIITAKDLKESQLIRNLLHSVLILGNFLNAGGYAGDAAGFRLNSLLTLADFKANNSRISLLNIVVMEAEKRNIEVTRLHQELKYLKEAAQWSVESIRADVQSLEEKLEKIKQLLEKTDSNFRQQMNRFVEYATQDLCVLLHDLEELETLRQELAVYFCEEEKSFQLDDCFRTFNSFVDMLVKGSQENRERQLLEEKAEHRRRLREAEFKAKRHSIAGGLGAERKASTCKDAGNSKVGQPRIAGIERSTQPYEESPSEAGSRSNITDVSMAPNSSWSRHKHDDPVHDNVDGTCSMDHRQQQQQPTDHSQLKTSSDASHPSLEGDCYTMPSMNQERSMLSRHGSFTRKRRSRDSVQENDLFSYLVQSRDSFSGYDLEDGVHIVRQQRRRRTINTETDRERIFSPLRCDIVRPEGDTSLVASNFDSLLPVPAVPSSIQDNDFSLRLDVLRGKTDNICIMPKTTGTNTHNPTRNDQNYPNSQESNGSTSIFNETKIVPIESKSDLVQVFDGLSLLDGSATSSQSPSPAVQLTDKTVPTSITDASIYSSGNILSCSDESKADCSMDIPHCLLEKVNLNDSSDLDLKPQNDIRISSSSINSSLTLEIAQLSTSRDDLVVNDLRLSRANGYVVKQIAGIDQITSEMKMGRPSLDDGLVFPDQKCPSVRAHVESLSQHASTFNQQALGSLVESSKIDDDENSLKSAQVQSDDLSEEWEEAANDHCSLGNARRNNSEENSEPQIEETEKLLKRLVACKSPSSSGNSKYESSSLDRLNPKKRCLLPGTLTRCVDDAIVPSSTLRNEQELEQLDLKVQEFQSKTRFGRGAMINKLKRLSLIYSGGKEEEGIATVEGCSALTAPVCRQGLKCSRGIGSSISSFDDVASQSKDSVSEETTTNMRHGKLDCESKMKDEGFESEGLSDPNISSQRSSMYSTGDYDLTTETEEPPGKTGNEMPCDLEDGTAGAGSGCGASYFSRSIDSIVVNLELTPVEVDLEEHPVLFPCEQVSDIISTTESTAAEEEEDLSSEIEKATTEVSSPNLRTLGRLRTMAASLKIPTQQRIPTKPSVSGTQFRTALSLTRPSKVTRMITCPRKLNRSASSTSAKNATVPKEAERPMKPSTLKSASSELSICRSTSARQKHHKELPVPSGPSLNTSPRAGLQGFVRGSSPRTAISPPTLRNNKKVAAENRSSKLPQSRQSSHSSSESKSTGRPTPPRSASLVPSVNRISASVSQTPRNSKLPLMSSSMRDSTSDSAQQNIGKRSKSNLPTCAPKNAKSPSPSSKKR